MVYAIIDVDNLPHAPEGFKTGNSHPQKSCLCIYIVITFMPANKLQGYMNWPVQTKKNSTNQKKKQKWSEYVLKLRINVIFMAYHMA